MHTGEVELLEAEVGGITVHIAALPWPLPNQERSLPPQTMRDLALGSDITLDEHGTHPLKA